MFPPIEMPHMPFARQQPVRVPSPPFQLGQLESGVPVTSSTHGPSKLPTRVPQLESERQQPVAQPHALPVPP